MSVGLYDKALTEKILRWVNDPNMTITGPDETRRLFLYKADVSGDLAIQLPLIAIRRGKSIDVLSTGKKPTTFDSLTLHQDNRLIMTLQEIPISLSYQIDIYTRKLAECDEYVRNFVFNIINYPQLEVHIPYQDVDIPHHSNIKLSSTIEDNSDIPERLVAGLFTRQTIHIVVDDAYFWSIPIRKSINIDADAELAPWSVVNTQ